MKSALFGISRELWSLLPESLRRSPALLSVATRVRQRLSTEAVAALPPPGGGAAAAPVAIPVATAPATPAEGPAGAAPETVPLSPTPPGYSASNPRIVSNLAELDEMLVMLDRAAAISDDELRKGFATFQMRFPMELPDDPDSDAYRQAQMKLYEWLHGKPYAAVNEVSAFDIGSALARPFPYSTASPKTVGDHLIGVGHVIRTLDLKAGQSVLEFGPGWGNTTVAMARMGLDVTAIDIEPNFVELIRRRAEGKGIALNVMQGDFSMIHGLDRKFDAVLFFECFHHCAEHQAMVAALDRVVAPGGKVLFAAEPILDEFPIPWGLRLDGESLWAIRKQGWLELGFQETYFRGLLARHGWQVAKVTCPETLWGNILVATRAT